MDLSEDACRKNAGRLVEEARRLGKVVEIDMESSDYVDRTLRLVIELHESSGNVRSVIQAYLRRSEKDVERLCEKRVPVRLCKGAYREPASVAFRRKSEVDRSYVRLMKVLLERGNYPALATHDERIIGEAQRFAAASGIGKDRFEFQMLYGIRRDLERRFVEQGYRLRLYVPFGHAWYPYFMRRLAERPANLLFLMRNLVRG
jgi:proline dehydrogenase